MRKTFILSALTLLVFAGSAAAEELTGAEIKQLLSGNTVYLEVLPGSPAGEGRGVIYVNADGKATFKTPAGAVWDGPWTVNQNTLCFDWQQVPNNPCSRYEKQGTMITSINVTTGKPRAKFVKVEKGNPEKL